MNAIMNEKGRQTKLLAAVAIIAMVVCALAVVMPSDNVDAVQATSLPADVDGVITVDSPIELDATKTVTVTERIVLNSTLTITKGILDIDYEFQNKGEFVITFGPNGKLIVNDGATVNIDAKNGSAYTPETGAGNSVFAGTTGYTSTGSNAAIQVSGTMNVTGDATVKGNANQGDRTFYITGTYTSNANGYATSYFIVDDEDAAVSLTMRDGSVAAYVQLNAGTMTVAGNNTTTASGSIFTPYAMNIGEGATLNANGSMSIYSGSATAVAAGVSNALTIKTVVNNGTIAGNGTLTVPEGSVLDDNGTVTATLSVNGTYDKEYVPTTGDNASAIEAELNKDVTVLTVPSGTISSEVTVPENKEIVIENAVSLGEEASFDVSADGAKLTMNNVSGKTFGVVTSGANGATFTNIAGNIVVTHSSVDINGTGYSGTATITDTAVVISGELNSDFDLIINAASAITIDDLKIPAGTNLNISLGNANGASITSAEVTGTLDLYGGITYDGTGALDITKDGSGVINIYSGSSVDNVTLDGTFTPEGGQFQFGDTLNSNYTVTTDEYLSTNLTIPAGVTLTIGSGANLNLAGFNIYVYGTLDIQANGSISGTPSSNGSNTVYLMRNGAFTNAGTIGEGTPVTVAAGGKAVNNDLAYTATGSVIMQNITGISFGLANTGVTVGQASYILTVTGNVQSYGLASTYTAEFKGVRIIGDLYVGQGITATFGTAASTIMSSATLTVDGTVDAGAQMLVMANNSTIVVNGNIEGVIEAQTGDYASGSNYADSGLKSVTTFNASKKDNVTISGYTLTVGTYEYQEGTGSNAQAKIAQRLYVEGTVAFVTSGTLTTSYTNVIALSGEIIVAEGSVLSLPSGLSITGGEVVVEGEINFPLSSASANCPVAKYEGSYYTVTVMTPARATTGYIVPFETAMGAIENADNKKVTVMGDLEIVSDLTNATGQTLDISKAVVTIDEDAEVILQTRAILTGAITDVDGMFTAYNGATYVAPLNYDTYAKGTDYVRYSGIVAALNNAVAGDVIDVTRPVTDVEDLTVPQGVTVNATADITIDGDLVVETEATLKMANSATLSLAGEKSTATIDGTLNLEEGTIDFSKKVTGTNALTSAGTTVMTGTNFTAVSGIVNGAVYTNEDSMKVITNAAAALAAAAAQDINKTVSLYGTTSSGDLTAGVDIVVESGAKATVSSIALADGETITLNGELTGAVTVQTGVAGSETASTVDLNKASGIVITAGSVTDNQGVKTYELQLANATNATMAGKVTVSAGTANIATSGALTVNGDGVVLTVASGATLIVGEGETLNVGDAKSRTNTNATSVDAVVVEGTLVADKGAVNIGYNNGTSCNGFMLVSGTFQVADETDTVDVAAGSTLTVTGTLDISTTADKEAVVAIDGILVVGEKPNTVGASGAGVVSGAVSVANDSAAYIKAYNGSDLSAALINIGANGETTIDSTAFYINSELYMTVYAEGNVAVSDLLTNEKFSLVGYLTKYGVTQNNTDGIDIEIITDWYTDAEMSVNYNGSNAVVGNPDALYFKAQTATVDVVISVGTGISLYIDNIKMTSGVSVELAVGTHTVSATVDPGYTGTTQVMFNGNVVSGSFEITADMASGAYEGTVSVTATGDIQQQTTVIDGGNSGDSSMGLTDYLLIILVILIVVMAIIVALRLMRS